ncbi:MAG: twitching motility protein PilT [Lachnospiraceae bacterium]|nr:twitching motility protein PilT [Lachnospiraceae bacterium]
MVQLVLGKKGKGKTRHLLGKANSEILNVHGNIVYLDKNTKHMYELNNKIRLINVMEYNITDSREFIGFINGIISQDHDLEQMYFDSFFTIGCVSEEDIEEVVTKLERIGKRFNISFVLSCAVDESEVPESLREKIIISL